MVTVAVASLGLGPFYEVRAQAPQQGEVFVPFHYDEQCVNLLTLDEFDPVSREPNYKQCAVRLDPER